MLSTAALATSSCVRARESSFVSANNAVACCSRRRRFFSLALIFAVSSQIQQIFFNLILNAFDVMAGGGSLEIRAKGLENGVEIQFEDSGPGIPEELRNNIFEPFFSTKDGGTGLGLTVSYNIVTAHGGTLDLVKGSGDGACFRLFLPSGVAK